MCVLCGGWAAAEGKGRQSITVLTCYSSPYKCDDDSDIIGLTACINKLKLIGSCIGVWSRLGVERKKKEFGILDRTRITGGLRSAWRSTCVAVLLMFSLSRWEAYLSSIERVIKCGLRQLGGCVFNFLLPSFRRRRIVCNLLNDRDHVLDVQVIKQPIRSTDDQIMLSNAHLCQLRISRGITFLLIMPKLIRITNTTTASKKEVAPP